jgi:hypothetical protein
MSPLLQQVLQEIELLTTEEQLEVLNYTTRQLKEKTVKTKRHKLSEFRGIAPNLLEGRDAQDWVNELRDEWEEREKRVFEGL